MGSPTLTACFEPRQAPTPIGLAEVHAWVVDLRQPAAGSLRLLDSDERERAGSYARRQDGARFAGSRAGLRLILGSYLDADPARLRLRPGPGGRPVLAGDDGQLQFSLSRSTDLALVAVSRGPVGADIEHVTARRGLADLIATRFAADEVRCIESGRIESGCIESGCMKSGCVGSPLRGFYRHWTAKEAYLKASGRGLAGLRDTALDCGPSPVIRFRGSPAVGWNLWLTDVPPAHAAAIVASQPVTKCWQLAAQPDQQASRARPAGCCR